MVSMPTKRRGIAEHIYDLLTTFSRAYCDAAGLEYGPGTRTRPWAHGTCAGVAYHYTGGASFEATARWFNGHATANRESSCHVLIDDGVGDDLLGKMWRSTGGILREVFPAPLVTLAPWNRGVWCTNWINDRCLGVELRNRGFVEPDVALPHGRALTVGGGRRVERYTREQVLSAIRVGAMAREMAPMAWSDDYVLGHSAVSWRKRDPGPDFPIHLVRREISHADALATLPTWASRWPANEGDDLPRAAATVTLARGDDRGSAASGGLWADDLRSALERDASADEQGADAARVVRALAFCGYNVDDLEPDRRLARFRRTVAMFQRCYNEGHSEAPLSVDGWCGPATWTQLLRRAKAGLSGRR